MVHKDTVAKRLFVIVRIEVDN